MTSNNHLEISIGGIYTVINSKNSEFITKARNFFSNFIEKPKGSPVVIDVTLQSPKDYSEFSADLKPPVITFNDSSEIYTITWQNIDGKFNIKSRQGKLNCAAPLDLSNFLRIIYSMILLEENGFLVHAASLIKNSKGYLFPGKSGAGKTTITRLSPEATLLSDEVSLVKMVNGKFHIFGTPFWGDLAVGGENTSAPLEAVYFPVKDEKNYIKNLGPSKAMQKLLPNVMYFSDEIGESEALFNLCYDFVVANSTNELHFLPENSFWGFIDAE